jgi:hypothetical protein
MSGLTSSLQLYLSLQLYVGLNLNLKPAADVEPATACRAWLELQTTYYLSLIAYFNLQQCWINLHVPIVNFTGPKVTAFQDNIDIAPSKLCAYHSITVLPSHLNSLDISCV